MLTAPCLCTLSELQAHEGNMYRNFEGEADRSHHGLPPDNKYSVAYNMRTSISKGGNVSGSQVFNGGASVLSRCPR